MLIIYFQRFALHTARLYSIPPYLKYYNVYLKISLEISMEWINWRGLMMFEM